MTATQMSRQEKVNAIVDVASKVIGSDGIIWIGKLNDKSLNALMTRSADQIALEFEKYRTEQARAAYLAAKREYDEQPHVKAKAEQEKARQQEQLVQDRRVFAAVCRALATKGLANVSDNDSNFKEVRRRVTGPLTTENVTRAILDDHRGLISASVSDDPEAITPTGISFGFAPFPSDVVRDWQDQAAIDERSELAREIANAYSQDKDTAEREYQRLMRPPVPLEQLRQMNGGDLYNAIGRNTTYETTEQLRERVNELRERQSLRSKSISELREIVRAGSNMTTPTLPEIYNKTHLLDLATNDRKTYRQICERYGYQAVTDRLNGIS